MNQKKGLITVAFHLPKLGISLTCCKGTRWHTCQDIKRANILRFWETLCYLYSKSISFHEVSIDCTCDHSLMALLMISAIQITCDPECFLLWLGSLGSQPHYRPCGIVDEVEVQTSCLDRDVQLHNAVWGDLLASCWPSLCFPFTAKSVKDFLKTPGELARFVWIILISSRGLRK